MTSSSQQRSGTGRALIERRAPLNAACALAAGPSPRSTIAPAVRNDLLARFVVATASDGYRVVLSAGELSPDFGARPDLLAYAAKVGNTVTPSTTDDFARTTAPGDAKGGRYVSNVVDLSVRTAAATSPGTGGGPSTSRSISET